MSTDVAHVPLADQQPQQQQPKEEKVQVDMSNMIGRIKPKPVCLDATMRKQSTPYEDITKRIFAGGASIQTHSGLPEMVSQELSVVSSGSSTASREHTLTDSSSNSITSNGDTKQKVLASVPSTSSGFAGGFLDRKGESERISLKVKTQTISRNGRLTQRWYTDPSTNVLHRMTTGCIPVLQDGKILLCSASRKPDWILPKGGWENDEVMEESAIRETFEEAGVFGIIGPKLSEITYETRKGKKRRIEFEEVQRKVKQIREAQSSSCPKPVSPSEQGSNGASISSFTKSETDASCRGGTEIDVGSTTGQSTGPAYPKSIQQHCSDGDNVSVASETSMGHAHIKMSLYPLYVTEVCKEWPENGRFRKVVDIDEAIRITGNRPYFQSALKELKERKLHFCSELQNLNEKEAKTTPTETTTTTTPCVEQKQEI